MIDARTTAAGLLRVGLWMVITPFAHAAENAAGLSVTDAVVKAVNSAVGNNVFNRHQLSKDGSIRPNYFRRVEVLGEKRPDGSIRVLFSLPTSSRIVAEGRMATQKLLEVRFTGGAPTMESFATDSAAISEEDDARFCRGVASVLRQRKELQGRQGELDRKRSEFAVTVSKRESGQLFVNMERIPYVLGGHTGYVVSAKGEVVRVIRGR
jgi:hypothetical protein